MSESEASYNVSDDIANHGSVSDWHVCTVNNILQAHADDNNGNDKKKPCNDQHSESSTKCSQKDTTPFILPFP